ncbi:MAG: XRE family transcriptional regulator [Clostridia bacterium]|nr:XRE family transcriptional regulator [Clostridia bacterium]
MRFKNGKLIRQARINAGLSIKQLAEKMGVSYNTITNWECDCGRPNVDYIRLLCDHLDVSADYLLGVDDASREGEGLDTDEKWLVNSYRSFSDAGRRFIKRAALSEIERAGEGNQALCNVVNLKSYSKTRKANFVKLHEYYQPASAGFGDYLNDDDSYDEVELYSTEKTRLADMIIHANGDSMQPEYFDGDRLLVMKCDSIDKGKTGVFMINGEGFVKVFEGDRLASVNKRYKDIVFSEGDDIRCVGLVIGKVDASMIPVREV